MAKCYIQDEDYIVVSGYIFREDDQHPTMRVNPDEVSFKKYKKNPVVTYMHDYSKLIGRTIDITPTWKGTYATVRIFKTLIIGCGMSWDAFLHVSKRRDIALTAGFSSERVEMDGNIERHHNVDLLEISVVPSEYKAK